MTAFVSIIINSRNILWHKIHKNFFEKKQKILSTQNLKISSPPKKITSQKNVNSFIKEVQSLRDNDKRLLQSKNYEVFFASGIPYTYSFMGKQIQSYQQKTQEKNGNLIKFEIG